MLTRPFVVGQVKLGQYPAAGEVVYVPRMDGMLSAVHAADGAMIWQMYLGEAGKAGVVPTTGRQPRGNTNCAWEIESGAALYSPAAIAPDGTVLQGNGAGTLFAIEETR